MNDDDIRNLLNIQQRRSTRQDIFPMRRRRRENMAVILSLFMEQGRNVLGELMLQRRIVRFQDFRDALALRRRLCNCTARRTGD